MRSLLHLNELPLVDKWGANWSTSGAVTLDNNGKFSKCLYVKSGAIVCDSVKGLGSTDFTVDFWINYTGRLNNSYYGNIVSIACPSLISNVGVISVYVDITDSNIMKYSGFNLGSAGTALPVNTWTHFALERYNNSINIYLNGKLIDTKPLVSTTDFTNNTYPLLFGEWLIKNAPRGLEAYYDEIRISDTAVYKGNNFTPESVPYGTKILYIDSTNKAWGVK